MKVIIVIMVVRVIRGYLELLGLCY
jgi:hypothetical protein